MRREGTAQRDLGGARASESDDFFLVRRCATVCLPARLRWRLFELSLAQEVADALGLAVACEAAIRELSMSG